MIETKDKILDTAERLFAEQGYTATSLRSITSEAGVNLASIHYHFGSKEALLEAVLLRKIEPLNQERLALLDQHEQEAGSSATPLEQVLEAFLVPTFRMAQDPSRGGPLIVRLMGRLYSEGDILPNFIAAHFGTLLSRFSQAVQRALPELPPDDLHWRMHFAVGAMAHTLRGAEVAGVMSRGLCDPSDGEATLRRLVAFLCAGFCAPVPRPSVMESK